MSNQIFHEEPPRYLPCTADGTRHDYVASREDSGETGFQLKYQGSEKARIVYDPTTGAGTEGSTNVYNGSDLALRMDSDYDPVVVSELLGGIARYEIANQAALENIVGNFPSVVSTSVELILDPGSYDLTFMVNNNVFQSLYIRSTNLVGGQGTGYVNGFDGTITSAGNTLNFSPASTIRPWGGITISVGAVISIYSTQSGIKIGDYTITSVTSVTSFEVTPAPPATFDTGDVVVPKPDVTLTIPSFSLNDLLEDDLTSVLSISNCVIPSFEMIQASGLHTLRIRDSIVDEFVIQRGNRVGQSLYDFVGSTFIHGNISKECTFLGCRVTAIRCVFIEDILASGSLRLDQGCLFHATRSYWGGTLTSATFFSLFGSFELCQFYSINNSNALGVVEIDFGGDVTFEGSTILQDGTAGNAIRAQGGTKVLCSDADITCSSSVTGSAVYARNGSIVSFSLPPNTINGGNYHIEALESARVTTGVGTFVNFGTAPVTNDFLADATAGAVLPVIGIAGTGCFIN